MVKIGGPLIDIDSPDVDENQRDSPQTPPATAEEPKPAEADRSEKPSPSPSGKVTN